MAEALEIERSKKTNILFMRLKGRITEDSNVDAIYENAEKTVVMNLQDIERINSYGIRQWINALKELSKKTETIIFVHCPPSMIEQFNMISNFGGNGVVYSFYLPYYCEHCDREELKLFELPDGKTPQDRKPLGDELCSVCKKTLVLNDIEEEYFYFLQYQKGKGISLELLSELKDWK